MKIPQKLFVTPIFYRLVFVSLGALSLVFPEAGKAESWRFDPTFQRTPLRLTSESASAVKLLSSGKLLIYTINGELLSGANGQRIGALIRVDPNTGAIDPTWRPDPTVTAIGFLGVAEAPDGKIYYSTALTGELANPSDPAINRLIRLNADGSRDATFNSPVFTTATRFITVQPDGKILVCSGGVNQTGVASAGSITQTVRLNTDGSQDSTFQSPVFQSTAAGADIGVFGNPLVDPATSKIYFCGSFRFVNGQARKSIARCNPDGTLDTGFVPTGLIGGTTSLLGRSMLLQGDKVVLGGTNLRTAAGGNTRYALVRFNNDGTLDSSFTLVPTTNASQVPLVANYFGPYEIAPVPGGKILTTGPRVLRFLADGALDSTFTPLDYSSPFVANNGIGAFHFSVNPATGAAYLANPTRLYTRLNGIPVDNVTKITPAGAIDSQFTSPLVESEDFAPSVKVASNGKVFVSGMHTAFGNAANATIARLNSDGTRDSSYVLDALPFADKQAYGFALLPDSTSYVVYYSGSFNGGYAFSNLVRLLTNGALDTTFRPSNALQTAFAINAFDGNDAGKSSLAEIASAPNGKLYLFPGGAQATVNGNGNLKPTRVNADGTEDTTVPALGFPVGEVTRDANNFITGGSAGYIRRLVQTSDGGFVVLASVAPFPTSTGGPYNYKILKLQADGSVDQNYSSPSLTSTGSALLNFPSLFDPVTGTVAQPPNGFYEPGAFAVAGATSFADGSVILVGNFRITGNPATYSIVKLTPTGALDNSFSLPSPGPQNSANPNRPAVITNARVAPDGKLWLLGRFDAVGGVPAPGVGRLNANGTLDSTFQLNDVSYYDSFGDYADVVFANNNTAYLVGTFRRPGEPYPFAVTRIVNTPLITSPTAATVTAGQQFVYQFNASGATSLSVNNLPPGLSFDPALSAIVGSPTTSGTFQVELNATNSEGTTTTTLVLTVQPSTAAGPVITSGTSITGRTGSRFTFQVVAKNASAAARLSVMGLPAGLTFDAVTGIISGIVTVDGTYSATLTVTDGVSVTSGTLELTFSSDPALPVIISPSSATINPGQPFFYQIVAPAVAGPNDPTIFSLLGDLPDGLFFDPVAGTISGTALRQAHRGSEPHLSGGIITNVQLFATNSHGTTTIPLNFFTTPTGAGNISTRGSVGTGDGVLIVGFIITGDAPKKMAIRAIAPSLSAAGVGGVLSDPVLSLQGNGVTATNDDWRSTQEQELIDVDLAPRDNRESAMIATLAPGAYTAIVSGKDGGTGVGLVELYDLGTASLGSANTAKLANLSTRGFVQTGDSVMIGGFIIRGASTRVVIRAIGPTLHKANVAGVLEDTTLQLFDGNGTMFAANDDWGSDQAQAIIDTQLAPEDPREAAIVTDLNPGGYTAIVRGKDGTIGIGLVEVFVLN